MINMQSHATTAKAERDPKHEPSLEKGDLPSEQYVVKAMPQILGKFDMTASYVIALFLITNAVVGATGGPVSLIYLGLGALVFFLPCVVATTTLGLAYPHEGSLYNWTHKALGSFWGFFIGLCYWLTGVLAAITGSDALVTTLQGLNNNWLPQPWQQGVVIIVILVFAGIMGMQRMRTTQNVINGIFILTLIAVGLIGLAALVWLAKGHPSATNFADRTGWAVNPGNFALFGIITLNFIGASGPLNMAGEIEGRGTPQLGRIIKGHLLWGTCIVIGLYFIVTLSVLVVRGQAILNAPVLPFEAFTAVSATLGVIARDIAVICFMGYCLAAAIFYSYISTRVLMAAGIDQFIPTTFGRLNKSRVPAFSAIFQAICGSAVTALVFILIPAVSNFGGNAANTLIEIYTVMSASTTLIWTVATMFFFIDIVFLYRKIPALIRELRAFPMPIIWTSVLVGAVACLLTIGGILYYPWIPQLIGPGTWWYVVGGLTLVLLVIAGVLSMIANSQASWEGMNE